MFRRLGFRVCLTIINIFFPPLSVMILTGAGMDTMINSILFLCGVLPSHVHGFYLSCTYFHRRGKAKKGRYPGDPKPFIYSERIINGGISNAEVDEIVRRERGLEKQKSVKRRGGSQRQSQMQQLPSRSNTNHGLARSNTQAQDHQSDGYSTGPGVSRHDSRMSGYDRNVSRMNSRATGQSGGMSRMDSRTSSGLPQRNGTQVSRVGSRANGSRQDEYGSTESSPISPRSYKGHWWN